MSRPFNGCQPRLGTTGAMTRSIWPLDRLEPGWLDLLDFPSIVERIPDLLLSNSPRPVGSRLLVRKAEDVQQSAWPKNFGKPLDEDWAILVGKGVEQAAVDHRVELPAKLVQLQGIPNEKMGCRFLAERLWPSLVRWRPARSQRPSSHGLWQPDTVGFLRCHILHRGHFHARGRSRPA